MHFCTQYHKRKRRGHLAAVLDRCLPSQADLLTWSLEAEGSEEAFLEPVHPEICSPPPRPGMQLLCLITYWE